MRIGAFAKLVNLMLGQLKCSVTWSCAIGHNRYSQVENQCFDEIQPIFSFFGGFALAHNGNLTNVARLRASLVETGSLFQSSSDTEIIAFYCALASRYCYREANRRNQQIEGAFSLVCIARDMLIGVRDPHGVRLVLCWQDAFVLPQTCTGH